MTAPQTPSDAELLRRIMAGDEDAFLTLYRSRQGGIYRYALNMSGSASIAEEVTQEVFLTLAGGARQYDPSRGSVAAYLFGVARNHVRRRLERDRRYTTIGDGEMAAENPLDELTRRETIELVHRAVLALPASYREAVVLCDLEEVSYAEAAQVLECAVGTVRSRLHRGRALLAEKLGGRLRPNGARCLA